MTPQVLKVYFPVLYGSRYEKIKIPQRQFVAAIAQLNAAHALSGMASPQQVHISGAERKKAAGAVAAVDSSSAGEAAGVRAAPCKGKGGAAGGKAASGGGGAKPVKAKAHARRPRTQAAW